MFEVNVLGVKTKSLPDWNEELAGKIREGMTLAELDQEARHAISFTHSHTYIHTYIPMYLSAGEQVLKAVEGEGGTTENLRNDKLATALLDISDIDQVRHTPLHLHPPHDAGRPNLTYGRGRYRPV